VIDRKRKLPPVTATLRVGGAAEILTVLQSFGVDPDEVLPAAGLDQQLFDNPDNLITYAARDRLLTTCVARTGCQHFGLLVGQRMNLQSLGLVGMLMRTSPDVEAALRGLISFLHLHSQGAVMTLKIDGDVAILTYDTLDPGLDTSGQTGDGAVAMMLNVMRSLCGRSFLPIEASFAHRKPKDIQPFHAFFGVPVYFNAEHYALLFSPEWLDAHPGSADTDLHQLVGQHLATLQAAHSLEFPHQVRVVLRSALMAGSASEDQVAEVFAMRSHTLCRRLEEFGTGFRKLVDECRFEIAQQMLGNTTLSVRQIGDALGYSRASSFVRAFRRWSGSTPARWRAALGRPGRPARSA